MLGRMQMGIERETAKSALDNSGMSAKDKGLLILAERSLAPISLPRGGIGSIILRLGY
jgi:hypothetical protein